MSLLIYFLFIGCLNRLENPSPLSSKLHLIKALKYHIILSLSAEVHAETGFPDWRQNWQLWG